MAGPADFGFDLLPPDPGSVSADLALDAALAPVVDLAAPAIEPLGRGWAFDFKAGQFVKNGLSPAVVYDADNLRVWIEKTLRTARFAHVIYSDTYGMEDPFGLIGEPHLSELVGLYERNIVDALLVHDRIAAVENFQFTRLANDDALYVSFEVVLDGDPSVAVAMNSVPLGGPA